jgi:hypothetical protein
MEFIKSIDTTYWFLLLAAVGFFYPQIEQLLPKLKKLIPTSTNNPLQGSKRDDPCCSAESLAKHFSQEKDDEGLMLALAVYKHLAKKKVDDFERELSKEDSGESEGN